MNYDALAVAAFILVVGSIAMYRLVVEMIRISNTYYWCYSKNDVQSLQSRVTQLENQIKWFQTHATYPDKQLPLLVEDAPTSKFVYVGPFQFDKEVWYQCWREKDWSKHRAGKTYVRRGKRYLWVDEVLSTDKVASKKQRDWIDPFVWEFSHSINGTVQQSLFELSAKKTPAFK